MEYVRCFRGREVTVSADPDSPNVFHLDRDRPVCMAPVDRDTYLIYRGRMRLGEVLFRDGHQEWGWLYIPFSNRHQRSRKLHPHALAAIAGRVRIDRIFPHTPATFAG